MSHAHYPPLRWTPETIARFWAWQSQFPEHYFARQFGRRIAKTLARHMGRGNRALDFGCGPGFLCRHLALLADTVWAIEPSAEGRNAANTNNTGLPGWQGAFAIDDIRPKSLTFDRIVASEVIEHIDDDALGSFFSDLRSVLAPGGLVAITTPNEEDLRSSEIYCPSCNHTYHRYQHIRSFSAESLAAVVSRHGLEIVSVFTTDFSKGPAGHMAILARRIWREIRGKPSITAPHIVCLARLPG